MTRTSASGSSRSTFGTQRLAETRADGTSEAQRSSEWSGFERPPRSSPTNPHEGTSRSELNSSWERNEFAAYHRKLLAIASRQLGEGDAEDVVSEAFLQLLESRDRATPIECPRAYLVATMKNLVCGEIRRRVRQRRFFEPLETNAVERPSPDSPPARAALFELDALLARLGRLDSSALVLRSEGFGVAQVAAELGISHATVQRRVETARRFLRHSASRNALLSDYV